MYQYKNNTFANVFHPENKSNTFIYKSKLKPKKCHNKQHLLGLTRGTICWHLVLLKQWKNSRSGTTSKTYISRPRRGRRRCSHSQSHAQKTNRKKHNLPLCVAVALLKVSISTLAPHFGRWVREQLRQEYMVHLSKQKCFWKAGYNTLNNQDCI